MLNTHFEDHLDIFDTLYFFSAGGRFEVDERSGVVRTRGTEPFQLDMEYVLYVKAEDQNGRDGRRYQVTCHFWARVSNFDTCLCLVPRVS